MVSEISPLSPDNGFVCTSWVMCFAIKGLRLAAFWEENWRKDGSPTRGSSVPCGTGNHTSVCLCSAHVLICSNHLLTTYLRCSLFNMFCFNPFTVKGVSFTQTRRLHNFFCHDHIPTNTLICSTLSPSPLSYTVCLVPCAFLFTVNQSIHLDILFIIHFLPT